MPYTCMLLNNACIADRFALVITHKVECGFVTFIEFKFFCKTDFTAENAEIVHTPAGVIFAAGADAFIIGGATVYRQFLSMCDRVYVTRVFASPEADAFFPDLDADPNWEIAAQSEIMEENGLRFQYVDYVPVEEEEDDFLTVEAPPEDFAPIQGFSPFSGF